MAQKLSEDESARLNIEIHSDNRGGADRAKRRTESQAKTIRALLIKNGVSQETFSIMALGADQPRLPNLGPRNMRVNRRVVFTLTPAKSSSKMPLITPSFELSVDGQAIQADDAGLFKFESASLPGDKL